MNKPTPTETHDMVDGFTITQCREMAKEMIAAKEDASLLPIAQFDGDRVMWLIAGLESHAALAKSLALALGEVKAELEQAQARERQLREIAEGMSDILLLDFDYRPDYDNPRNRYKLWKKENKE